MDTTGRFIQRSYWPNNRPTSRRKKLCQLYAVSKRQVAIFDGSELASIISFLSSTEDNTSRIPDLSARATKKTNRLGAMPIVVGTMTGNDDSDEKCYRIVGVEVFSTNDKNNVDTKDYYLSLEDGTLVYADSIAYIPEGVSDVDAIATTAAALCGVHCGSPNLDNGRDRTGKVVVVGGSDYACFTARGLDALGAKVSLVTTRPGINIANSKVEILEPLIGKLQLGFTSVIGTFDSLIDTLRDEGNLNKVRSFKEDKSEYSIATWVLSELKKQHSCQRYISTVTRSQMYVLKEGLLFARNPVTKYQGDVEKKVPLTTFHRIRPPKHYGTKTLQKLFDSRIIYKADKNENGPNANKNVFVRGWSLSDLAEGETWPRETTEKFSFRAGFPIIDDKILASIKKKEKMTEGMEKIGEPELEPEPLSVSMRSSGSQSANNNKGYVLEIDGVRGLNSEIATKEKDCVLFLYASYCKTCKPMLPRYNRMARINAEESNDIMFARANIAGTMGLYVGKALGVSLVPSFVLFRAGEEYGEPITIKRLPSKKLDLAITNLKSGKPWDPTLLSIDENRTKVKT